MTRIVAGRARGRRLAVPAGEGTRPTSDRAREGLFSTVESMLGPLHGTRALDLYAGSGALGLEALSRGAGHVLLVEQDRAAAQVIRSNVDAVGLPGAVVSVQSAVRALAAAPAAPYDLVLLDPPYALGDGEVRDVMRALARGGWLSAGAVVVVERPTRGGAFGWPEELVADRSRRYGEGTLWYGRPRTEREDAHDQPGSAS